MATTDLVHANAGLTDRQVNALEKLNDLGAEPRLSEDEEYSKDPKIRALQLVYEGKLGGPRAGAGRKARETRAAAHVAKEARRLAKEIAQVYEDIMTDEDGDPRLKMQAADRFLDIEHREASLALKEEEFDSTDDMEGKEELIDALFDAISNPEVEAIIAQSLDIPEEDIEEITDGDDDTGPDGSGEDPEWLERDPADLVANGVDTPAARRNGRGHAARSGEARPNPFSKAAKRRAAD